MNDFSYFYLFFTQLLKENCKRKYQKFGGNFIAIIN
ncbi:hypothetical protein Patl1_26361 [Pistacia atlantica]|uniref:Uncharacterized protein n=1 Tax=Pistacia atlantica TaxID=434234 RepID=A0ACC1B467_9ROSI|nr:hypothetical protein Patl1_26361 [Pistacia atlantica]